MAADRDNVKDVFPSFVTSDGVFRVSECQSCSLLKKVFASLINELKSGTEIINILKDELKYDGATKQGRLLSNVK